MSAEHQEPRGRRRFGRKLPVLIGLLVCVAASVFVVHRAPSTQEGEPGSGLYQGRSGNAAGSAATCSKVPYGSSEIAEKEPEEGEPYFGTPPNQNGPTLVDVGFFVDEITEVSPIDNTFKIEGFMDLVWCDPREAFDPEEVGVEEKIYLEKAAQSEMNRIWSPDLTLVNEVAPREVEDQELIVYPDGTTEYQEKFGGQLEARYDFTRFPFDRQTLEVEIESFAWNNEFVVLHQRDEMVGFSEEFQIPDWRTESMDASVKSVQEARDRAPFSEFLAEIEVVRESGFYIWKILIPLILMVAVSWSVFWMTGDGLADRVGVSFTGILTVVAYQFIMSDTLPKVTYFTFWDAVLTLSFVLMALTIAENIFAHVLYPQKEGKLAARVDRTCRWAFPLVYAAGLMLLAVVYLL